MTEKTHSLSKAQQKKLLEAGIDIDAMTQVDTDVDNYPKQNWDKNPVAYGTILKIKDITVRRIEGDQVVDEDTKLMIIENPEETVTVFCSTNLENLFKQAAVGQDVVIHFTHMEPMKEGKKMRKFDARLL